MSIITKLFGTKKCVYCLRPISESRYLGYAGFCGLHKDLLSHEVIKASALPEQQGCYILKPINPKPDFEKMTRSELIEYIKEQE